ncbi:hypothetical protein DFH28DRAFT_1200525 [Melampsora americana]|nr:hypothetical protein DFH28DRAFT_1200525 [Melampsora americana]
MIENKSRLKEMGSSSRQAKDKKAGGDNTSGIHEIIAGDSLERPTLEDGKGQGRQVVEKENEDQAIVGDVEEAEDCLESNTESDTQDVKALKLKKKELEKLEKRRRETSARNIKGKNKEGAVDGIPMKDLQLLSALRGCLGDSKLLGSRNLFEKPTLKPPSYPLWHLDLAHSTTMPCVGTRAQVISDLRQRGISHSGQNSPHLNDIDIPQINHSNSQHTAFIPTSTAFNPTSTALLIIQMPRKNNASRAQSKRWKSYRKAQSKANLTAITPTNLGISSERPLSPEVNSTQDHLKISLRSNSEQSPSPILKSSQSFTGNLQLEYESHLESMRTQMTLDNLPEDCSSPTPPPLISNHPPEPYWVPIDMDHQEEEEDLDPLEMHIYAQSDIADSSDKEELHPELGKPAIESRQTQSSRKKKREAALGKNNNCMSNWMNQAKSDVSPPPSSTLSDNHDHLEASEPQIDSPTGNKPLTDDDFPSDLITPPSTFDPNLAAAQD